MRLADEAEMIAGDVGGGNVESCLRAAVQEISHFVISHQVMQTSDGLRFRL